MELSPAQLTLIGAVLASPIWIPVLSYAKSKVWARATFRGWQAIFINTPGYIQTYFGKITSISKTDIKLKNIYYLSDGEEITPETKKTAKALELVKLGEGQLHYPEDVMIINRSHIVFMENMNNEAPVVKAIQEHQGSDYTENTWYTKLWESYMNYWS